MYFWLRFRCLSGWDSVQAVISQCNFIFAVHEDAAREKREFTVQFQPSVVLLYDDKKIFKHSIRCYLLFSRNTSRNINIYVLNPAARKHILPVELNDRSLFVIPHLVFTQLCAFLPSPVSFFTIVVVVAIAILILTLKLWMSRNKCHWIRILSF